MAQTQTPSNEENPEEEGLPSFYRLLEQVVCAVGDDDTENSLSEALDAVRRCFSFDSAFVYEHDPLGRLVLQEHAAPFDIRLPAAFSLDEPLPARSGKQPSRIAVAHTGGPSREDSGLVGQMRELFASENLFLMFILGDSVATVGCVGMAGSGARRIFDAEKLRQAETLFRPIVERSRKRIYKRKLDYTTSTLESIMDHIGFDIYVNDFDTHEMLYANRSMAAPYGGWKNMMGRRCYEALYDDRFEECPYCPKKHLIDEEGNPSKVYSWDYQRPFDGRWFRVISAAFQWTDGRLAHVISSTDIDEAKNNELLIKRMAYSDLLTGVPNRRKLEEDFQDALARARQGGPGISVLFLDLDGFKQVNDVYGHSGGDILLKHVSSLFEANSLTADHFYRYGGDEFIFLYEDMSAERALERGAEIAEMLAAPLVLDGDELACSGSVGCAHYPEDGSDYWELLDRADEAMYRDKDARRCVRV